MGSLPSSLEDGVEEEEMLRIRAFTERNSTVLICCKTATRPVAFQLVVFSFCIFFSFQSEWEKFNLYHLPTEVQSILE